MQLMLSLLSNLVGRGQLLFETIVLVFQLLTLVFISQREDYAGEAGS